jgi:hypothetical protein
MEKTIRSIALLSLLAIAAACSQKDRANSTTDMASIQPTNVLVEEVLTAEQQAALTPDEVIQILKEGNEHCGAVKAAVDDVKLGNITPMLEKIKPAVEAVNYSGERNSENAEFVQMVCESNVQRTISQIRNNSPILMEMEENGEIKIAGAIYDMDNGKVTFLD